MGTSWPKKRRLIGSKIQRLDGPAKATGKAKYSYDINRKGMLHAVLLRSPHAHAKIKSLDSKDAEKMPGVKAVYVIKKVGEELFWAGEEILGLAADTEEHALDAVRAIKIDYEVLPHTVKEEDALKQDRQTVSVSRGKRNNVMAALEATAADFAKGMADAAVTVEGEYGVPTICHQCLESHGLVAEWGEDGGLTVWASTQAVWGTAAALAGYFAGKYKLDLPASKVQCITHYMGGGFGSKFGPDIQGNVAAELARIAKAPVKLMLDRADEIIAGGCRPSAYGKVKVGAMQDGKITAYEVDCYGTPGIGASPTVTFNALPYVYPIPYKRKHTPIRTNAQQQRAMRAPNHPQNSTLTEFILDDLAAKLGMDPMQLRLKNLPQNDANAITNAPHSLAALRHTIYTHEIQIAAALSKWKEKWHPPGQTPGIIKHGIGMALHTWGGQAAPQRNECIITITADGSVTARTSTQDLGTGQRTVTALITAEILGLEPEQITLQFGESLNGSSSGSGGSTTIPSQSPATLRAATAARDDLFAKIAPKLDAKAEKLVIERGKVRDTAGGGKTWDWKQACAALGGEQAKGEGFWTSNESNKAENKDVSSSGVGGVQIAEVTVDTETGVVRCTQIVAVQDCGMVVNQSDLRIAGGRRSHYGSQLCAFRGAYHGPRDRPSGQRRHGVLQARRHRGHAENYRAYARHAGARRHRHRRAAGDFDACRHRQRHFQRHRRKGAAHAVYAGTSLGRFSRQRRWKMKNFAYYRPKSAEQAVALLDDKWGTSELLAGGTDLLDLQKEYIAQPDKVISLRDLKKVDEKTGLTFREMVVLEREPPVFFIGAGRILADIAASTSLKQYFPALTRAAGDIGGPQIRNMGTLGGNLCQRNRCWYFRDEHTHCLLKGGDKCFAIDGENRYHALFSQGHKCVIVNPSTLAPVLIALGATAIVQGPKGSALDPVSRILPCTQFGNGTRACAAS